MEINIERYRVSDSVPFQDRPAHMRIYNTGAMHDDARRAVDPNYNPNAPAWEWPTFSSLPQEWQDAINIAAAENEKAWPIIRPGPAMTEWEMRGSESGE